MQPTEKMITFKEIKRNYVRRMVDIATQIHALQTELNMSDEVLSRRSGLTLKRICRIKTGYRVYVTLEEIACLEIAMDRNVLTTPLEMEFQQKKERKHDQQAV